MRKILVIEDEQQVRDTLLEILEAESFEAIGASDGQLGLQLAQKYLPDLILCDVNMPVMDGYEVLQQLRQDSVTATIPFIFLTARGDKADLRQGMSLGADDYLTKPCTVNELLTSIESRLSKQATTSRQYQKKLDDLRNNIALSLPHELCTPLNGILGLSEILIDEYHSMQPYEILEIAEDIHTSGERLYRLIQNFLLYAELDLMQFDPEKIKVLRSSETSSPHLVTANVAEQVAKQFKRLTDLQLTLAEPEPVIKISDLKLRKIVEELVSNAFKFSEAGTPVRLISNFQFDIWILYVIDQGRGMTPEQIVNLGAYMQFERKIYEQQGSGLGLTIAKRLTELHGGEFLIESLPNQQTVIRVMLPTA